MYLVEFIANACVGSSKCKNYSYFHFDKRSAFVFDQKGNTKKLNKKKKTKQTKMKKKKRIRKAMPNTLAFNSVSLKRRLQQHYFVHKFGGNNVVNISIRVIRVTIHCKFPCDLSSSRRNSYSSSLAYLSCVLLKPCK